MTVHSVAVAMALAIASHCGFFGNGFGNCIPPRSLWHLHPVAVSLAMAFAIASRLSCTQHSTVCTRHSTFRTRHSTFRSGPCMWTRSEGSSARGCRLLFSRPRGRHGLRSSTHAQASLAWRASVVLHSRDCSAACCTWLARLGMQRCSPRRAVPVLGPRSDLHSNIWPCPFYLPLCSAGFSSSTCGFVVRLFCVCSCLSVCCSVVLLGVAYSGESIPPTRVPLFLYCLLCSTWHMITQKLHKHMGFRT